MTQQLATPVEVFACPGCRTPLAPPGPGPTSCPHCQWRGEVYLFNAKALNVVAAETALPEDAACAHHPRKRATAVCAGTGDYICALCAVDLNGQTYSAQYLDAGGKEKATQAFDRKLARPDVYVYTYLVCIFIPYVNFVLIPFVPIWVPHAFVLYFRSLRMRRENPLFARLMSGTAVFLIPFLLVLVSVLWIVGLIALINVLSK